MRLVKLSYDPRARLARVSLDLAALRRAYGSRWREAQKRLLSKAAEVLRRMGAAGVRITSDGLLARLDPEMVGFAERDLLMLEHDLAFSSGATMGHVVTVFRSVEPLEGLDIAIYRVLPRAGTRGMGYELVERMCSLLALRCGVPFVHYGPAALAAPLSGSEALPPRIELPWAILELHGTRRLRASNPKDRARLVRMLSRALRRRAAAHGLWSRPGKVLSPRPRYASDRIHLHEGVLYRLALDDEGTVYLMMRPKHELLAARTLWEEAGRDRRRLLEASKALCGRMVRRTYDLDGGIITEVLPLTPKDRIPAIGTSLEEAYAALGLEPPDPEEPAILHLSRLGLRADAPSKLRLVYTMKELKELEESKHVYREANLPPPALKAYLLRWLRLLTPLELGPAEVRFSEEMMEV